ncbi:transmembrane amino acid transporter protein (macronuclear) [Tetrahymena thermophila SB210]|uniref:Transmembrane amino acid transporter protein n=1 Tax=Tetrahymena thermophila (strain SB210) TaxID=312017 RepID=I7MHJ8_TETTS|nr:transmembrane amino acid transporter protein [Tetrahymena thermophila SB210]EAS03036.1 transmembrane amino acid transporter protein [Tetrahymena thermophila SB210]|eukprot:XP_001023281.1 transmembrane amino acid transporter protein [Tetrahymena thermophila SB210]
MSLKDEEQTKQSLLADNAVDEEFTNQGASVMNATANIIKSGIGTGLLFMPYVFSQCGIVLSIVFMGLMGAVAFYCWSQLCRIIRILEQNGIKYENHSQLTLETAAGLIMGEKYKHFSIIVTLIFIYGSSVGYCIFILQTMQDYIPNYYITLAIVFVIYMPLSMFRQIEKLGIFSQFALVALSFSICVILGYSSYQISDNNFSGFTAKIFDFSSLPLYFGVFAFAYDINGVVTEVHASMKEKHKFNRVLFAFIFFSFVLGSLLGVLGYYAFKDDVNSVIFKNFNDIGAFSTIISSLISLSIVASILLYGFPIVKTVDRLTARAQPNPNIITMIITRLIFFLSISFQGIYVQSITNVFNLLGCVFSVILTFVLPMILLEKMKYLEKKGIQVQSRVKSSAIEGSSTQTVSDNTDQQQQIQPNQNQYQVKNNQKKETLPQGILNTVFNILVVVIGITGGVSGLISSIIDLSS